MPKQKATKKKTAKKTEVKKPARRRVLTVGELLTDIAAETIEVDGVELTKREAFVRSIFKHAIEGKSWAAKFVSENLPTPKPRKRAKPAPKKKSGNPYENMTKTQLRKQEKERNG